MKFIVYITLLFVFTILLLDKNEKRSAIGRIIVSTMLVVTGNLIWKENYNLDPSGACSTVWLLIWHVNAILATYQLILTKKKEK